MKKGRFLWSAYRITEKQKAGKARNIKGKQLKNSRSTASKRLAALPSSASADFAEYTDYLAHSSGTSKEVPLFSSLAEALASVLLEQVLAQFPLLGVVKLHVFQSVDVAENVPLASRLVDDEVVIAHLVQDALPDHGALSADE